MNEIYGLAIKRNGKKDYCIPMPLSEIDTLFIQYPKEIILQKLKENDSVITETNPECLTIEKYQNGRWVDKNIEIITDSFVLEFPLADVLDIEASKILNILYSHLKHYLEKEYIRKEFKEAILATKEDKKTFLEKLDALNYTELRKIRLCIYKTCDLKKEIEALNMSDYLLQRKAS